MNAARLVDCMEQYPLADGAVLDGPEWGYEIAPFHQDFRSYIFNDLPPDVADGAAQLGYDYGRMVAAKERLFTRLHHLTDCIERRLSHHRRGASAGGPCG